MREHNYSSISNTSIHEAYPGHHLQLAVANRHPSLTRLLADAPEFVEGWGMYSEQLMREQGFDDAPNFRLALYTDAIWRACRIILDVRMHRGELSVDEATDFLVAQTSFEGANARAEVNRYTYTPDVPAVVPPRQGPPAPAPGRRAAAARVEVRPPGLPRHAVQQRLAARSASIAGSCARRSGPPDGVERGGRVAGRPGLIEEVQVIPSIDLDRGRSRVVFWPGASSGVGAPTDRPDRIAERFVELGARVVHVVDFDGARTGSPGNLEAVGAMASRIAVPIQLAGGLEGPDQIRLAFAAGRDPCRPRDERGRGARACSPTASRSQATGSRSAWIRGRSGSPPSRGAGRRCRRSRRSSTSSPPAASAASSCPTAARSRTATMLAGLARTHDADFLVAGGVSDLDGIRRLRDIGVTGIILGQALLSGAIDFTAALEAAA